MSVKDQLLEAVRGLPDNATWEEAEERLRFLAAIDEAGAQIARGEAIPHEKAKAEVLSWFQK